MNLITFNCVCVLWDLLPYFRGLLYVILIMYITLNKYGIFMAMKTHAVVLDGPT